MILFYFWKIERIIKLNLVNLKEITLHQINHIIKKYNMGHGKIIGEEEENQLILVSDSLESNYPFFISIAKPGINALFFRHSIDISGIETSENNNFKDFFLSRKNKEKNISEFVLNINEKYTCCRAYFIDSSAIIIEASISLFGTVDDKFIVNFMGRFSSETEDTIKELEEFKKLYV